MPLYAMILHFKINYKANWGETLCLIGQSGDMLSWSSKNPLKMTCTEGEKWSCQITLSDFISTLHYKYALLNPNGTYTFEFGTERELSIEQAAKELHITDYWRTNSFEQAFKSKAFVKSLFSRKAEIKQLKEGNLHFQVEAAQVRPTEGVAIVGNIPELGNWDTKGKFTLSDSTFPLWKNRLKLKANYDTIEYKYVIYDLATGEIKDLEGGENRTLHAIKKGESYIQNDYPIRYTKPLWKGAGVAIPLFSIRTNDGFGIGEFYDLKKLADWASATGQKMIQTLPINDTTLYRTNRDSYPYNAVSVFALNPIYLRIEDMGELNKKEKAAYLKTKEEYNKKTIADYQIVANEKERYFRILYKQESDKLFETKPYKKFFEENKEWLVPYAAFCYFRDLYKTPHFGSWKTNSKFSANEINKLTQPTSEAYTQIAYYYFLQYHLHTQLSEAIAYVHSLGIAVKGDIPIGISPDSVEAWTNPELFNLNSQAGAPPDDFSVSGQNWGFPTYNWEVMAQDGYSWWKKRFQKMADYFDAYRIDHILGFFRIWEMGKEDVWGLTGRFSPALPYTLQELHQQGITLDEDRMLKPYIRENFLHGIFGESSSYVKQEFLLTNDNYIYYFKPEFDTQKKIEAHFAKHNLTSEKEIDIKKGLFYLHSEVLFVRDLKEPSLLHPRIMLYQSNSYNELYDDMKQKLAALHNHYFYQRHNAFWKESAMKKLPSLIEATDMLVCGEDLGMVPDCVQEVMQQLEILSLEIQRMPKDPKIEFFHPANAPYLSVCTTGTHDMNTIRAWWEEERGVTQRFYNQIMGKAGEAPQFCSTEIAKFIINQHLYSPAMWVVLPMQDWMAIDEDMRYLNPNEERINLPENPLNFWCYRMHVSIEEMIADSKFNEKVKALVNIRN